MRRGILRILSLAKSRRILSMSRRKGQGIGGEDRGLQEFDHTGIEFAESRSKFYLKLFCL